jgi:site-specific recombinase XerD
MEKGAKNQKVQVLLGSSLLSSARVVTTIVYEELRHLGRYAVWLL